MIDINYILPELFISISLMFILLIGVFKKKSSLLVYNLTMISLFILIILLINLRSLPSNSFFGSSYIIDELSNYMKIITVADVFGAAIKRIYNGESVSSLFEF